DVRHNSAWARIQCVRKQAVRDGLEYAWSDTCRIDKSSSQELTGSINSMCRWYWNSQCCCVYLHDM
ncbi:uncharacterized protein MYCFIDRAFT_19530, partial [Pseudocercospora fijiensis CIRAD86]